MDKRVLWVLLIGVVLILAFLVFVYMQKSRAIPATNETTPRLFQLTPTPSSRISMGEIFDLTNSNPVVRIESTDGNVYFRVAGAMVTDLVRQGVKIVGEYGIDGDPGATRVRLEIGIGKDAPDIAYFPGDFDKPVTGKTAAEKELVARLTRGENALLYINTGPSGTPSPVRDALESVTENKWSYLSGITLSPATIGIFAAALR
ncbi:hypothetical protein A2363_05300 [Candidatus Gottesmanbacteria bacterium RIFOXYB1_FULL_47_11]|uniref:Uncharacterized protein n=1 Tax=Candidatus Gottesmanbacteria bacterium RIFOXYB1_FULL_47_11 TaxID=1798401 RepID=A0A1F6BCY2_9BACT|nr:MAG: hypothetical protein A2363_05300 [Candidatus Gottesmanbacteria bacterium RIFOXYB1_FULL_47_11]